MTVLETDVAAARAKAKEVESLDAFISLSEENGAGRPVAIKDLIDVEGMITTGGALRENPRPATEDAEVVKRLRAAGWAVVGKTNMHEWALGPTSGNPHYGAVRNPVDPDRVAGGSSGGSAAAIAAGVCRMAIGTDTGGSIRIPSALCGTVGIRPTLGLLPLDGVWPLSPTCDTVGPMGIDVQTVASAMVDLGAFDSVPETPAREELKLAAPKGWITGLDETTAATWERVGGELPEVDLPPLDTFIPVGLAILYREAYEQHREQLRVRPETLGDDLRELLTRGSLISDADYERAMARRGELSQAVEEALQGLDALVLPTTAVVAPLISEGDPIAVRDALTCFTRPFGVTGHPGVSLPGPTDGLPVGIQLIGKRGSDSRLLAVAASLEKAWQEMNI